MTAGTEALLELIDVRVRIPSPAGGVVHPLQGVDLRVGHHQAVGLVGESGSGKSMTVRAILQLLPRGAEQYAGEVCFQGRRLDRADQPELQRIRGREITMIFQDPASALDPMQPVGEQIADVHRHSQDVDRRTARDRAVELLGALEIADPQRVARRYPHQLSGGMAQRVNIAMALIAEPLLLLADEPTTGLDVTTQAQVLGLLREQLAGRAASLLFISHDLRVVAAMCEVVGVMYAGVVMEFGPKDALLRAPANPYTRRLLECARLEPGVPPRFIPGSVPALDRVHELCPFRDRCDMKIDVCDREPPPVVEVGEGHISRCHRS